MNDRIWEFAVFSQKFAEAVPSHRTARVVQMRTVRHSMIWVQLVFMDVGHTGAVRANGFLQWRTDGKRV